MPKNLNWDRASSREKVRASRSGDRFLLADPQWGAGFLLNRPGENHGTCALCPRDCQEGHVVKVWKAATATTPRVLVHIDCAARLA